MGPQFVERRAERPLERIMGQSMMTVQSPQNASIHSNERIHFLLREEGDDDPFKDGTHDGGTYNNGTDDKSFAAQSWLSPPPSCDSVRRPEPLWQPYYMEQYDHDINTVDQLQHLGTFGMEPPYRFGTHEDDPLAKEYTKTGPASACHCIECHGLSAMRPSPF